MGTLNLDYRFIRQRWHVESIIGGIRVVASFSHKPDEEEAVAALREKRSRLRQEVA